MIIFNNKKIILVLVSIFLLMFLLGSVSAILQSVSYSQDKKEVIVKDFLGLGSEIAKINLANSLTQNFIEVGKDRVVFQMDIETYWSSFNDFLGNTKIKNMRTGSLEEKSFKWVYAVYGDVKIEDSGLVCKKVYSPVNKTDEDICRTEITGSHIENEIVEWKELTEKNLLKGKITIGLMTDVIDGDSYDGIPNLFGKDMNEWVTWFAETTNNHGQVLNNPYDTMGWWGQRFWTNETRRINSITGLESNSTLECHVVNELNNTIADSTFTGDECFLTNAIISANQTFFVLISAPGNTTFYHHQIDSASPAYNFTGTINDGLIWTAGVYNYPGPSGVIYPGINDIISIKTQRQVQAPPDEAPNITQYLPINYFNTTSNSIIFNVSATDDFKIQNISLFIDGIRNYTLADGTDNHTSFQITLSLADGTYLWSGEAVDNASQRTMTANRTLTIDTTAPVMNNSINLLNITTIVLPINSTWFYNVSDIHLQNCYYNTTDNSTITFVTCNSTIETQWNTAGNKTIYYYANDSFGNENYKSTRIKIISINYSQFENKDPTFELENVTFNFSITTSEPQIITSYLWINNTRYNPTSTINSSSNYNFSLTINIPFGWGNGTGNLINWYWNYTTSGVGENVSTDITNITIFSINIDDCSTYTNVIYNFSLVDEETQILLTINTSIELNLEMFMVEGNTPYANISKKFNSINPAAICLSTNFTNESNYYGNTIVKYSSQGYVIEYYNIVGARLNKSTVPYYIILYDLDSTDSTDFKITFTGSDYQTVENALIYIERQYISENNTFKTIELPKTDSNGQTVGHFVRNNVIYNIRVIKAGNLIGNFQNIIAFCQDVIIGNCQIFLNARSSQGTNYSYAKTIGLFISPMDYNSTTGKITESFIVPDGTTKTVLMNVTQNNIFGNRTLCSSTLTAASGTLSCTINPNIDETTINAEFYVGGVLSQKRYITLDVSDYGSIGFIVWFILTLILIFIFDDNKTAILISLIVSYVGAIALAIIKGSVVGIGASGIWIIIITILAIYKINKENPQ